MAFQKSKETQFGVTGDYWKITYIEVNRGRLNSEYLSLNLSLYIDAAAFTAGKSPIESKAFLFSEADYDFLPEDNILSKCYIKIKAQDPFFADAVDVLE